MDLQLKGPVLGLDRRIVHKDGKKVLVTIFEVFRQHEAGKMCRHVAGASTGSYLK